MNELVRTLKLTESQWRILRHRLEVPDAIADCLTDDDCAYSFDEVERVAELLCDGKLSEAQTIDSELVRLVLIDACNGSTYCGATEFAVSPLVFSSIQRSAESLGRKVSQFVGETVDVPTC